jgi:hypothetical protein
MTNSVFTSLGLPLSVTARALMPAVTET